MNKLIILGNGFDLACNWKTKFSHFLNETTKDLKGNFHGANFLIFLLYKLSNYNYLKTWRSFFGIRDDLENWADVENLLNIILFNQRIFLIIVRVYDSVRHNLVNPKSGVECALYEYFENRDIANETDDFLDFLYKEINDFEMCFCVYLNKQLNDPSNNFFAKQNETLYNLIASRGIDDKIHILNFNYTPVSESAERKDVVHYVHGKCSNKNIIIGVDPTINDDFKNNKQNFKSIGKKANFTKTFRKLLYHSKNESTDSIIGNGIINNIVFYGHSLSPQDYSYFQSIFDYCNLYSGKAKLEFCYTDYDEHSNRKILNELLNSIYSLINEYGATLDNKDHGKNLLNKLILEGRISIREIKYRNTNITINGKPGKFNTF